MAARLRILHNKEIYLVTEYSYAGKSILQVDAQEKVTGGAVFSSNVKLPGMLFGKTKRSPYPFAKILSINTSKALKLPGVKAVITAPATANAIYNAMGVRGNELPITSEKVLSALRQKSDIKNKR